MLRIDVRTQNKKIGRIEVLNLGRKHGKATKYAVTYKIPNGLKIEFDVYHIRCDGAIKLLALVSAKLFEEVNKFFSLPTDKIEDGMIRCKDIPERYKKAFNKYSPVNTGGYIDGDMAMYVHDIEGWLTMMRNGIVPMWD